MSQKFDWPSKSKLLYIYYIILKKKRGLNTGMETGKGSIKQFKLKYLHLVNVINIEFPLYLSSSPSLSP